MREQEMRERVFKFLKARMRNMIMPATVGLGLAVGGCSSGDGEVKSLYMGPIPSDASSAQSDATAQGNDGAQAGQDLAAQGLDQGLHIDAPVYGARVDALPGSDQSIALDAEKRDASASTDGSVTPGSSGDAAADLGEIIAKYIAPVPDASTTDAPRGLLYMAQMPDSA